MLTNRWRIAMVSVIIWSFCVGKLRSDAFSFSQRRRPSRHRSLSTTTTTSSCLSSAISNIDQHKKNRRKTRHIFQTAKQKEKAGKWKEASQLFDQILENDPTDSHTHLALATLQARRETASRRIGDARRAFERGVEMCPDSVHLWQAWARYEQQSCQNVPRARELFQKAMELEGENAYVCHSFGLMERKLGNKKIAKQLWEKGLRNQPTAALVCSLAELYIQERQLQQAQDLYLRYVTQVKTEREKTEIYLASAWLEEKYFRNFIRAEELIEMALVQSPTSGRAQVALARLEARNSRRRGKSGKAAARKHLSQAVASIENGERASPTDGRLFNAWARMEVKSRRFEEARKILSKGMERYPDDISLLNAAGRVEQRLGNFNGARTLYEASLTRQPTAPTLVALAMLELGHPLMEPANHTIVKTYFERALLLDPRHGPAYNAYGNTELKRGNVAAAREVYKRGVRAECTDAASVFHGLAKLELGLGNIDIAREILIHGLKRVEEQDCTMDSSRFERGVFLIHTLGMLELKSNRVVEAAAVFKAGLAKYERWSQLFLGAALCEVKLGSTDKARHYFERAVTADRKHSQAWQAWGVMESRAGNVTVSKRIFETGLKASPHHGPLWHAYGVVEARMGSIENARRLFTAGLRKCPSHAPLYQGWAAIELRDDNLEMAKTLITEALTRDKTKGSSWLAAAEIEQRQGNEGLVGLILRRGIECAPAEASLYKELGEHLMKRNKISEAREVLETGLEVNPMHAPLYHSLAELEASVFNLEGLAKLNARAASHFSSNALVSSPSSAVALGTKIRSQQTREVPGDVAALFEKVGYDVDVGGKQAEGNTSPLESMTEMEDEVVNDLFEDRL